MAALLLGWSARLPGRLRDAVLHAATALQGVLAVTAAASGPAARASERSAEVRCRGPSGTFTTGITMLCGCI
jgi:hypothetical protein